MFGVTGIKYSEEGSGSESAVHPEEWTSPPKFVEQLTVETDGAYDLNYVRLICRVKRYVVLPDYECKTGRFDISMTVICGLSHKESTKTELVTVVWGCLTGVNRNTLLIARLKSITVETTVMVMGKRLQPFAAVRRS